MTLEELKSVLRDENDNPITKFELQDLDGNTIYGNELFVLDYYALREWLVEKVLIREDGYATIVLNGGNFKAFKLRNVF